MIVGTLKQILRRRDDFHRPDNREVIFFGLIALASFLPFLGTTPLFDWDEVNFAEAAREMLVTGDFMTVQIGYEPFWEKPPLFFWLQVISFKIFGVNEFAARFPNALLGAVVLPSLYVAGTRMLGRTFGRITAGLFFATLLPHVYYKTGIIDPYFNFFIFLSLFHLLRMELARIGDGEPAGSSPVLAGVFAGLAVLTKGPVAILIIALSYFIFKLLFARQFEWKKLGLATLTGLTIILLWFGGLVLFTEHGFNTLSLMLDYHIDLLSQNVAGHAQPFYYHFIVFTIGCFPMAAFCYRGMLTKTGNEKERVIRMLMLTWWLVVMIVFSIVKTKIIHYSSLLYYPGAFLGAMYLRQLILGKQKLHVDVIIQIILGIIIFGGGSTSVNLINSKIDDIIAGSNNPDVIGMLSQDISWSGMEFLIGVVFTVGLVTAAWQLWRGKVIRFLAIQMASAAFFLNAMNLWIAPKVSDIVQGPAIEFWKSKAGEDVHLMTGAYKSYAHLFYGQLPDLNPEKLPKQEFEGFLARGETERPVYLSTKRSQATPEFRNLWFKEFTAVDSGGSFIFFKREAHH